MDEARRTLRRIASQEKARENAAAAAARLREQRREREDVEAYVERRWRYADAVEVARDLNARA